MMMMMMMILDFINGTRSRPTPGNDDGNGDDELGDSSPPPRPTRPGIEYAVRGGSPPHSDY